MANSALARLQGVLRHGPLGVVDKRALANELLRSRPTNCPLRLRRHRRAIRALHGVA
jgi:hypothetical protein